jgi:uncharacterized damage-inducible protein DinB
MQAAGAQPSSRISGMPRYDFLVDTYRTEIDKVVSVWAMFDDADLTVRPHPTDPRGRSLLEQMVHQSVSEHFWFSTMLGISVTDNPLPSTETRVAFIRLYVDNARLRLTELGAREDIWWETVVPFFEVPRSRAWIMTRRIAHTAHHRGQQIAQLRMINRALHSTYGPTADTGGLMQHQAPVIYAYPDVDTLLREEQAERHKTLLPGPGTRPATERPAR